MITNRRSLLAGFAALTAAGHFPAWAKSARLETAYINGKIWTGDMAVPIASSFGVTGDRIVALGHRDVKSLSDSHTRIIDLRGAFVTPGLIDSHVHFLMGAFGLTRVNLRDAATRTDLADRLARHAATLAPGEWILGGAWDHELWGGELPTAADINAATPNNPVAVARLDGHMYLANSLAIKLAGVTKDTQAEPGGEITRDRNGNPAGVFKDASKALLDRVIPPASHASEDQALNAGIHHALERGVTQVHNMGLDWTEHEAFRRARAAGQPDMRFYSFVPLADHEKLTALVAAEGRGDEWVRWGGLKGYHDGSLGSKTAYFKTPYSDDPHNHGLRVTSKQDLHDWIKAGDRAHHQIAIHAIGDAAIDETLNDMADAVRANGPRDRRFRIEHAQHISPTSYSRFASENVIASMQPAHLADDGRWAVKRIGEQRLAGTYAFHSLLKAKARLAFGTDWPIVALDPIATIAAAVTRQTIDGANPGGWVPGEKIGVDSALHCYTANSAYAGFQENSLGKIAPGYLADFVIFSDDLTQIAPDSIHNVRVVETVVGGKSRYQAEGAQA
jgi:predicted amidohydrolase YtcJ